MRIDFDDRQEPSEAGTPNVVVPFRPADDPARHLKIAAWLRGIADHVASGGIDARFIAVMWAGGDHDPEHPDAADWLGVCSLNGRVTLRDVQFGLNDAARSVALRPENTAIEFQEHRERRRRDERESAARKAQHKVNNPWLCERCGTRFGSERGAETHERTCAAYVRGHAHNAGSWERFRGLKCSCGVLIPCEERNSNRAFVAHVRGVTVSCSG